MAGHSKTVKCNVKNIFIFEITKTANLHWKVFKSSWLLFSSRQSSFISLLRFEPAASIHITYRQEIGRFDYKFGVLTWKSIDANPKTLKSGRHFYESTFIEVVLVDLQISVLAIALVWQCSGVFNNSWRIREWRLTKAGEFASQEHTSKYLFINRFSSKQLKALTHKNSLSRILVLLLPVDI